MPRYELVEGTSSKFWEIEKSKNAKSYTVTWGRIGTKGQSKSKKFHDEYACASEYEKLVNEKLRKGYTVAGKKAAKPAAKAATKSNPELEAALAEAIDDKDRWLVYADWLQENGDVRGEMIALGAAGKKAAVKKLVEANGDALWGVAKELHRSEPFAGVTYMPGWSGAKPQPLDIYFDFAFDAYGFLERLSISGLDEEGHVAGAIQKIVAAPIGRFVRSIDLVAANDQGYSGASGQPNFDLVVRAIARAKPAALRSLALCTGGYQVSWTNSGKLGVLWSEVPNLEHLNVELGTIDLGKQIELPKLKTLRLETGGLARANLHAIGKAKWPALEELTLYLGCKNYGGNSTRADIAALLANPKHFPNLTTLALCNAENQGDVVDVIAKSPLLKQLRVLDLSMGCLIDREATPIVENAAAFKKLQKVNLGENYLSPAMEKTLKKALGKSYVGGSRFDEMEQERADAGDEEWAKKYTFRYTVVSE